MSDKKMLVVDYAMYQHANIDVAALIGYAENCGLDLDEWEEWISDAEDAYAGSWGSDYEFATEMLNSTGDLDDDSILARYFDYKKFAIDLMYDYFTVDGEGGMSYYFYHN